MRKIPLLRSLTARARRLLAHKRGNVAIITALTSVPIALGSGMAIDYTLASYRQTQLNGFADSATLSAVTPTAMTSLSATQAASLAARNFSAQVSQVAGLQNIQVNATGTDTDSGATVTRSVTLTYSGQSPNIFANLIGSSQIRVTGTSTATSSTAPNINFWMVLDDSPSMAIAATTTDINTMVAHTSSQGGCAFACHETHPQADNLGNPGGEDNYTLARNLGVTLRIDNVNAAVQNLMTSAQTTQAQYNTSYKFALYTMDYNFGPYQGYSTPTTLTHSQISNLGLNAIEVYDNNCLTQTNCNSDTDSYLDTALNSVNSVMPNPGQGTNNSGDTPQEVLFIVTDGVNDYYSGSTRVMNAIASNSNICSTIKNRGIRIAFLYLTYYPLPTNSFYNSNIAPFQPQIATAAQSCASPGLFFQVSTDGDISAAMTTLFQRAVATAHLSR